MPFDTTTQRHILGRFATGITVITTKAGDELCGLTANAFASLSLNPPLVLVAIDHRAHSYEKLKTSRTYAVNILRSTQQEVSARFAKPGPKDFSGLSLKTAETGAPILSDSLAWLDCRVSAILPGGDHDIFVGEIVAGEFHEGEPLLYFAGNYGQFQKLG
ncbi:MAG: flavin reductase family protein [Pirellulales bacterium]|nr:flavin reductase family protein [Pirellulales bacterium]